MRIVVDTNVLVSAFLWGGVPRRLLDAAQEARVQLYTSRALIGELEEVLSRGKFAEQLARTHFTSAYLIARYTQLAQLIVPAPIEVTALRDPKDAPVLACAIAGRVDAIVSGDLDLGVLASFGNIPIVTPAECLRRIGS